MLEHTVENENGNITIKKRGRKPKGGRIIESVSENNKAIDNTNIVTNNTNNNNTEIPVITPSIVSKAIIMHLNCVLKDVTTSGADFLCGYEGVEHAGFLIEQETNNLVNNIDKTIAQRQTVVSTMLKKQKKTQGQNQSQETNTIQTPLEEYHNTNTLGKYKYNTAIKEIYNKLIELNSNNVKCEYLQANKSCCFWDTCEFCSPPVYIPKYELHGIYHVYGCFCSPECATAFLKNEDITSSVKMERYSLLYNLYAPIYNYKTAIKKAEKPFYLLSKFMGNLTIDEYRHELQHIDKNIIVLEQPLTQCYPEIHTTSITYPNH